MSSQKITEFSPEVREELQWYVYRLVDPRTGKTFYIGKGKDNRVFQHEKLKVEEDNDEDLKYKQIREIQDSGLDVIKIIERYKLNDAQAKLVESVLINTYSLNLLTNKIRGINSDIEPTNVLTIQRDMATEEYEDVKGDPKYILIKVKQYWLDQRGGDRYETTRSAWHLSLEKARKYPYVLSVTNGIVREVYNVKEWRDAPNEPGRIEFTGDVAEKKVRDKYVGKRIPEKFRRKGNASACQYSDKK